MHIHNLQMKISQVSTYIGVPPNIDVNASVLVSQVTEIKNALPRKMMEGRNEQASSNQGCQSIRAFNPKHLLFTTKTMLMIYPVKIMEAPNECGINNYTCCLGQSLVYLNYMSQTTEIYSDRKSIQTIDNDPIVMFTIEYDDIFTNTTYNGYIP